MRAARLRRQGEALVIEETAEPVPGPGQMLVRLEACGVCHTDLHIRDGDEQLANGTLPLTLGHEGIGRVTALGAGVTGFALGDRVGVPWLHDTCMTCRDCLTGHESVCADQRAHGMHVDGAFAESVLVDPTFAVPIPDELDSLEAAPLLCAGVTAYGAVRKATLEPGQTCVIFGCGGLGQYAIQFARLAGARVIAVDRDAGRLREARALGAEEALVSDAGTGAAIRALGGADACINFAPSPAIWPAVEAALNPRGRFVSVAMPHEPVALSLVWLTWVTPVITGSSVGGRQELRDTLALAAEHGLSIPIEPIRLEEANTALDRLAGKPGLAPVRGRAVIDFTAG
ncbi:MAG: alcohol dehydrogenase catalytic domain-containing protein [Pseudomonadota bacterium]